MSGGRRPSGDGADDRRVGLVGAARLEVCVGFCRDLPLPRRRKMQAGGARSRSPPSLGGAAGSGILHAMHALVRWVGVASLGAALSGCVRAPYVWVYDLPDRVLTGQAAAVNDGDHLYVFVRDQPTMSGEVVVARDLTINVPVVGQVSVQGRTADQVAVAVAQGLTGVLEKPVVQVSLVTRRPARVTVVGEVRAPGSIELRDGGRVIDAVAIAGGLTEYANRRRLFVVRYGERPIRIRFRYPELAAGELASSRFVLLDGDVVVAE
jgi:polysaccharide export outer membrane protein